MANNLSTNTNLFQSTGFQVVIDRQQFGNFAFFCQRVNHPSASNPVTEVPFRNYASAPMPGGQLQYGDLSMDVLLDEDFNSYKEIYGWVERLAHRKMIEKRQRGLAPDNFSDMPSHSDIIVTALTNQNNKNKRITYHDCVPHTVGDITFESTNAGVEYTTFNAMFRFTYFVIE
jgi:hypothetical protein